MAADTRKLYTVVIGGIEHTLLLNAEDAERYGDAAKPSSDKAVLNKARTSGQ